VTEVWTWRGLVTYYTAFVIDLASRCVQIVGSTPHPDAIHVPNQSYADGGRHQVLRDHRILICDRDRKWSQDVRCDSAMP